MGEALADGDGRNHRQTTGQHDTALHAFDEVRDIAMAGVVSLKVLVMPTMGRLERIVGVAHGLDERLAEEERSKYGVAVAGQPLA